MSEKLETNVISRLVISHTLTHTRAHVDEQYNDLIDCIMPL